MNPSLSLGPRPRSLRQVSVEVVAGAAYASSMKEFIDALVAEAKAPDAPHGFYSIAHSFIDDEPLQLEDQVLMAHMGGLAEYISTLAGHEPPQWTSKPAYFLKEPFYVGVRPGGLSAEEATPSAFRRRLLFCGPALQKLHRLKPRPTGA